MTKYIEIFVVCCILILSLILIVQAQKPGTCQNPSGVNYCGTKSQVSECFCDNVCKKYGDCCTDFGNVCPDIVQIIPPPYQPSVPQPNPQSNCFDSDGGVNYQVYGFVNYSVGQETITLTDACTIGQTQRL